MFLALALLISFFAVAPVSAVDVNDFYFSDFTGDYYLTKSEDGISHLKVKESVTAVFPNFDQNKGICRQIPFTNHGGSNITLPRLTREDITITRNGEPEPIYSIEKGYDYYSVCTGTEEYVLGKQVYVFLRLFGVQLQRGKGFGDFLGRKRTLFLPKFIQSGQHFAVVVSCERHNLHSFSVGKAKVNEGISVVSAER